MQAFSCVNLCIICWLYTFSGLLWTEANIVVLYFSGQTPSLPELVHFPIFCLRMHIYSCYVFGVLLLNDLTGNVCEEYMHTDEAPMMKILQRWLRGNGRDVSWQRLLDTLRESQFVELADEIEYKRKGICTYICMCVLMFYLICRCKIF